MFQGRQALEMVIEKIESEFREVVDTAKATIQGVQALECVIEKIETEVRGVTMAATSMLDMSPLSSVACAPAEDIKKPAC